MFIISRVIANAEQSDESSNKNMGIFVVDQAPIKIANKVPFIPEPSPIYFIIVSLDTPHTLTTIDVCVNISITIDTKGVAYGRF